VNSLPGIKHRAKVPCQGLMKVVFFFPETESGCGSILNVPRVPNTVAEGMVLSC